MVWEAFLDPKALQAAMPGCERLDPAGPDTYRVTMAVGITAMRGTYSGSVQVADRKPPDSYRLLVSGSGLPGTLQGDSLMTLTDDAGGTRVTYSGELKAQGPIARLGPRVLGGTAKLMIGQFMKAMERQVALRQR
ncbi:MAG: carbon monoxide dehydrogenase subunit G [Chloroflexi bacterium]|nr:carbon monoxide dehydrogenase subunit G [Chloroflexota bacterium]